MAEQTASPRPAKLPYPLPAWGGPSRVFEPLTGQFAARGWAEAFGLAPGKPVGLPPVITPDILLYAGFRNPIRTFYGFFFTGLTPR